MAVMQFDDKGDANMRKNLQAVGVGGDLTVDTRVQILQQKVAELLTALQKAGIKTDVDKA